jgi:cysteine-rich repeat protein
MCKRLLSLCFLSALSIASSAFLSGSAQAGVPIICGDGATAGPEECDDSNTVNNDGCDENCRDEVCGNGPPPQAHLNEECDDGNVADEDGCNPTCQFDCGDGEPDAGEACDDGNGENGDGCDDDFANTGNCTVSACGNNVIAGAEECDGGNATPGDGCDANCLFEPNEQEKKQQACINAVNKNLAGVIKAQNTNTSGCVKSFSTGKSTDFAACFAGDTGGKIAKAEGKTTATIANKCNDPDEDPDFDYLQTAETVNDAGTVASNDLFTTVFGATPTIALKSANKDLATCQASAMALLKKQVETVIAEANKAKKTSLKGKGADLPAATPTILAADIDTALTGNAKILAAAGKVGTTLTKKKCTDAVIDDNFDCGGATTVAGLATCITVNAFQEACEALEVSDGLDLNCTPAP